MKFIDRLIEVGREKAINVLQQITGNFNVELLNL